MSLYEREMDFTFLRQPRIPPPPIELPTLRIFCHDCSRSSRIPMDWFRMVKAQINMWHDGWWRDPETGLDYCPEHRK
jgi:hypothetical protein